VTPGKWSETTSDNNQMRGNHRNCDISSPIDLSNHKHLLKSHLSWGGGELIFGASTGSYRVSAISTEGSAL